MSDLPPWLSPVEHDPFVLTPVEHDPFAGGLAGAVSPAGVAAMQAQGQVAQQALDNASQYAADTPDRMKAGLAAVNNAFALARQGDPQGYLDLLAHFGPGAMDNLAARSAVLYNPLTKPLRPFAADYPAGAATDATGRLTADIEGRPLAAPFVAGRRDVAGMDQPLSGADIAEIGARSAGARYTAVPPRQIANDAGWLVLGRDPQTGAPAADILLNRDLSGTQAERVAAHETGHLIDELAGQIPTIGIERELRGLYNTLNTGRERMTGLTGPQHAGYRGEDVPRELMAEAIRAYMADPNYLKTVAPGVAARIRGAVNAHPALSPHIQFNALAPVGVLAPLTGIGSGNGDESAP